MSVGYDLAGIQSPKIDRYINEMQKRRRNADLGGMPSTAKKISILFKK